MNLNWTVLLLLHWGLSAPILDFEATSQPNARRPPKHDVIRPIQWGDLNFIHTTDTHGWLAGHMLERQFSGDWGDFVSFSERMHQLADERGVDLIMVDTGDRHDGNGLTDASKHDGSLSLPIFCEADYDVVTIGNHELYRGVASLQEYRKIRNHFKDRYVVSNVEVAIGHTWVPMGEKYRLFNTRNQNLTVLAFGFLFNFEGNDKHTTRVTKVEDEIKQPWFQHVLQDIVPSVDYIVLSGHIPARDFPEFQQVLDMIRSVNQHVPVSIFAGHSHIRDYKIYDDYAVALQSGRYAETLGWASVNLTGQSDTMSDTISGAPQFSRSYIDSNQHSLSYHCGTGMEELPTENGKRISKELAEARKKLNLDEHKADVHQNYYTDRAPFPSKNSIYSLLQEKVLPLLTSPSEIAEHTRYIILNTGAVRFDLFKGPYTKDTGYILSPFKNEWFYIADVPRKVADSVLPIINDFDRVVLTSKSRYTPAQDTMRIAGQPEHNAEQTLVEPRSESFGYRTIDDLGEDGDDTIHKPWKFYPIPNAFQTITEGTKGTKDSDTVVMVFHDFVASFVQNALTKLGHEELFKPQFHGGEEVIELLPQYFNSVN